MLECVNWAKRQLKYFQNYLLFLPLQEFAMASCFTSLSHKLNNRLSKSGTINWSNYLYKIFSFQPKHQDEYAFSVFRFFFSICLINLKWIKSFSILVQWMRLKAWRELYPQRYWSLKSSFKGGQRLAYYHSQRQACCSVG